MTVAAMRRVDAAAVFLASPAGVSAELEAALPTCARAAGVDDVATHVRAARDRGQQPVVLLGPGEAWQRDAARRIARAVPGVPVLLLVPPAEHPRVLRALRFEPTLGRDVHLVALGVAHELRARIEDVAVAAQQRSTLRATLEQMNAQLEARRASAPEAVPLETQLREREERLRLALEATELGTWSYDPATGARQWDDRSKVLFGLPLDTEVDPATFEAALHPDDRARVAAALARALDPTADGEYRVEYRTLAHEHGHERWIAAHGRAAFDAHRRPTRIVGTLQDITAHHRADDERAELLRRAETARLEAEAANRLKDEFLATVSHELRTPLNAMLGWARMLRNGSVAEDRRGRALEIIERNALAQARLIEDLLDVSRILAGKLRLDVRPVDLPTVIDAALDSVRPAADARGVRLQAVLDPAAAPLIGDPDRLQQIVWNLLANAVKFTPRGGRVQVRLARVASAIEITVTDSGQGIDAAFLPYVFERFRQADASTTRAHGGLGLGLGIVRHLTELHGGTVRAASDGPGQGATFTVLLPLAVMPANTMAELRAAAPIDAATSADAPDLRGVRILVVDDDPDARELVSEILARRGAELTDAADVETALAAFARARFDLVLSDIGMPGHDGFALVKRIRARGVDAGGRTPVVALTAYARTDDRTRALRAGFTMHLTKPVDADELLAVVATVTGRVVPGT